VRFVVLFNPNSGRGRGKRVAEDLRARLESRGEVSLVATAKEPPEAFRARLGSAIAGTDLLIVAGGDGTLHHALPAVVGSGAAVYHLAMGTENLFAREFGMDGVIGTLERAVERWRVVDVDVGMVGLGAFGVPSPFVLMCSVGPDASVIRRIHETRSGPIRRSTYLGPMAVELLAARLPRLTIDVDGRRAVEDRRGMVVVANSRQYARRVDPAHRASMTDGLLDMAFFPCASGPGAAVHLARALLRRPAPSVVYRQGREVAIVSQGPRPPDLQVDGEYRRVMGAPLELRATVRPGAMRVLAP
jgi:diacylglycerol kinase (ATP)